MSNMMKINVHDVKAALELIRSFRNVPLDSIEWVDNSGMTHGHPTAEAAQDAGQGWWSLEDWKFCGLNNTSYFEEFIEPYIQVQEPVINERVDLSYGGIRGLTIKSHTASTLNVSCSRSGPTVTDLDIDHLIALADLRECVGRQMTKCPACDTKQVQLLDSLTNPLNPSWRCRSCKHRFHTTPTIPFNLLIRAKYGDLLKGQPVAAYSSENDSVANPVHICKRLCCMNDGSNALLPPYSVRLLTEAERLFFSKAKSFNISTTELFDAMADEEPKYGQ